MNVNQLKRKAIRALNALFPKNAHKVMFASMPDFSDNARALYDYMISEPKFSSWQFVWLVKPGFVAPKRSNTLFIQSSGGIFSINNLRYLYHLFTSKYLFCTHSHYVEANPKRQVSVCLWHGTMLKRICAMNEREKNQPRKDQYRYFVSPSKFYDEFFCKSFLCQPDQVLTCGYPRNDFLFQDTAILSGLGIDKSKYKKMVVYMPTFRTPVGGGYSDSAADTSSCICLTNKEQVTALSNELHRMGVLLIIKWHPSDTRQDTIVNVSNIISISNRQLQSLGLQVYHLLHYADALITDYSSVYCDYMVLDRPIAFDIADIDSYSDKRGFVFDHPLDYMPGMKMCNEDDFLQFCEDVANENDRYKSERDRLRSVYNDFCDASNSQRLLELIGQA